MVVTLKSFLREHSPAQIEGKLGPTDPTAESKWDYNAPALKLILVLCGVVAVIGMGMLTFTCLT